MLLSGFGRKDVVEHLLQTGANVHARDDGGLIPLHNACSFGHAEVVSLLLCQGADPNARDNWNYTPLHEAAIKGKIDVCIGKDASRLYLRLGKYGIVYVGVKNLINMCVRQRKNSQSRLKTLLTLG